LRCTAGEAVWIENVKMFGPDVDIREFARLYWERVEGRGAKVYLEQNAAQVLGDKTLDVEQYTEESGEPQLRFAIVPQATPASD